MSFAALTSMNIVKLQGGFGNQVLNVLQKRGYRLGKNIGEGSYSKVKVAYKTCENGYVRKIACKTIDRRRASKDFVNKFLPREISIIRRIRNQHIVTILEIIDIDQQVYIFMDLCEKGDLLNCIRSNGPLSEYKTKHLFKYVKLK